MVVLLDSAMLTAVLISVCTCHLARVIADVFCKSSNV